MSENNTATGGVGIPAGSKIRIVVADDHPIFRDGLRKLLETDPDLRVVGEAGDGVEAVTLARQLRPDILLLDFAMPRASGLDALRLLRRRSARDDQSLAPHDERL